jgi:hypothetical protein
VRDGPAGERFFRVIGLACATAAPLAGWETTFALPDARSLRLAFPSAPIVAFSVAGPVAVRFDQCGRRDSNPHGPKPTRT